MTTSEVVGRRQIVAFRLARQGLLQRRTGVPLAGLVPLGLQDTAVGAAAQALALRQDGVGGTFTADAVRHGDLVPTWGPRLAATLVPPETEALVTGALLDPSGDGDAPSADLVRRLASVALQQLRARGPLTKAELGEAIAGEVPPEAMQDCERCGRRHPDEGVVKMLVWTQRIRLEPAGRLDARVAPAAVWRPRRHRQARDPERADMVRSYLRLHGPATPADVQAWSGVEQRHAEACWRLVADELAEVRTDRGRAWCLAADLDELMDPPAPPRARLVTAYDPILQAGDRAVLVPDAGRRRQVWRSVANPGVALVDGEVIGVWRGRRRRDRFAITVTSFTGVHGSRRALLEENAASIARAVGCHDAALAFG